MDEHLDNLEKLILDLEFKNMLSNEEDKLSAIITINAGAGGLQSSEDVGAVTAVATAVAEVDEMEASSAADDRKRDCDA